MLRVVDAVQERWFGAQDDAHDAVADANDVLTCTRLAYFERVMRYLDGEIDRPAEINSEFDATKATIRTNTLKEIRAHLKADIQRAEQVIAMNREQ